MATVKKKTKGKNNRAGISKARIAEGMKLFGQFHSFGPEAVEKIRMNTSIPRELVQIGTLKEIVYFSDKDDPGNFKRYMHDFKKPYPILLTDPDGTRLFIHVQNKRFRVKAEGLIN